MILVYFPFTPLPEYSQTNALLEIHYRQTANARFVQNQSYEWTWYKITVPMAIYMWIRVNVNEKLPEKRGHIVQFGQFLVLQLRLM